MFGLVVTSIDTRTQFHMEWRISLFTALLLPGLLALGFWQLERANEKSELAAVYAVRQSQSAVTFDNLPQASEELAYHRLTVTGEYISEPDIYLDNRTQHGNFGYQLVNGFRPAGVEQIILVNRGWIRGDPARRSLPQSDVPVGIVTISGHLYVPPGEPFLLAAQEVPQEGPMVLQVLDPVLIAQAVEMDIYPWSLRLDPSEVGALAAQWQVVNVSPDKHRAYAFQWFAMAVILLLLYLWRAFSTSQNERRTDDSPTS